MKTVKSDEAGLREAAAVLNAGGVVVIPTDTVYGLAAHPAHPEAVERLYTIKGREAKKPIALLATDEDAAAAFVGGFPSDAARLTAHWPGALTVVTKGEGLRVPDHDWTRRLLAACGGVLRVTSANLSGRRPATDAPAALKDVGLSADLVVDDGVSPGGVPSTVVRLLDDGSREILRAGAVDLAKKKVEKRLESLDVLRGFDMFFIFLPDPAPCVVAVFLTMIGLGQTAFAAQFDHVAGAGLHFYDCIFPLFLFISGVTWPYSLASQRARGVSGAVIGWKIVKRMILLFLLGSMLWTVIDGTLERNILSFDWAHFRTWSVIGRIGIAWGVAAFLSLGFGRRTRWCVFATILLVMWAVLRFAVAPGAPAGINPLEHPEFMLGGWIDRNFLTTAHRAEGGFYTITMVATAMLGNFAGEILREATTPYRKIGRLCGLAALLATLGLLMAFACGSYSLPIHKANWSSSFVLVVGGISLGLLALFYWIVDVKGWRRWGFFFKVIGMNAITIYILVRTVLNYGFLKAYFFGGIALYLSPAVGEFVSQVGLIALGWALLYGLYRKNIFLRI